MSKDWRFWMASSGERKCTVRESRAAPEDARSRSTLIFELRSISRSAAGPASDWSRLERRLRPGACVCDAVRSTAERSTLDWRVIDFEVLTDLREVVLGREDCAAEADAAEDGSKSTSCREGRVGWALVTEVRLLDVLRVATSTEPE
jgi:hypothetical protein